jgi:hypothetical protein
LSQVLLHLQSKQVPAKVNKDERHTKGADGRGKGRLSPGNLCTLRETSIENHITRGILASQCRLKTHFPKKEKEQEAFAVIFSRRE